MQMVLATVVAWACVLAAVTAESLHFDAAAAKEYPVSKVVTLLKDMQSQLAKEQEADEEVYSKLACWCETNDKTKTKAVSDAEARISSLDNTIAQMTSLSATLNNEIDGLKKEIASNEKSLQVAEALRKKQKAEFTAEEKEMVQSISALKSAVVVLSKHQKDGSAAAFLGNPMIMKVIATAKAQIEKHAVLLQGTMTPSQKRIIMALAESGAKGPTFKAYKPQSGQIFGILDQMRETFETDLSNSQKEEIAAEAAFQDLKAAKEEQIATAQASKDQKDQQLAKTDETLAQSKEDKEDTEASLSADQKFLIELKKKCSSTDEEWAQRQKDRQLEASAIAKAISILHSDDARDQFSKTFNFIQISEGRRSRDAAAEVLSKAALANPKLTALAVSARLDPFPKVKKAIDKMITALLKEKADEIKHKDYCIDEFQKNELSTQKKTHAKVNLESKIAGLKQTVKEAESQIKALEAEMAEIKTQMKRAGEDRAAEKKDFEGVVADQRETQALLKKALDVLKEVYGSGVVLVQEEAKSTHQQSPPAGFSTYKKNTASTGVIMLLEQIIADAKEMEAEATHDEKTAVKEYKEYVKTSNESLKTKDDAKVTLKSQKAKAEKDLTESGSELDGTLTELETLGNGKGALHKSCDYTLKNFDVRQEARDQEVSALREAKAFLSGMKA